MTLCGENTVMNLIFQKMAKVKVKQSISNKPKYIGLIAIFSVIMFVIIFSIENTSTDAKVKNSPWDNSVHQVERYIKNNLSDPNSFEVIQWSKVRDMSHSQNGYRYKVMVKYRTRNGFGGYEIQSNIFFLDKKGNVVDVQ